MAEINKLLILALKKKAANILKFAKSYKKAVLTKKVGYKYNITKLSG